MNWEVFINSEIVKNLGWMLIHSIWQMTLVAFILSLLLRVLREFSAQARYLAAVFALFLAIALSFATLVKLNQHSLPNVLPDERASFNPSQIVNRDSGRIENSLPVAKLESEESSTPDGNFTFDRLRNFFASSFSYILPLMVGIWLLGVMFFAFRLGGGVWRLHRFRTREITEASEEWQARFIVLCRKLKITQSVKFLRSNLIETPIVVGWIKPVILIPSAVFLQISPHELETIITHELVHIRRYDAFVNFAQSGIEVLFFYHPGVWWISSVIRREREFATDSSVIEIFAESRITYANALANLEEIRLLTNQNLPPVATAANGGNLMQRITKILQKDTETRQRKSAWSAIIALALVPVVLLTAFSFTRAPFVNAGTKLTNKKLAVGFVSIPPLDRSANPPQDSDATARLMIAKLTQYKIPAIGFVTGGTISDGDKLFPVRANIVRLWRDAGFEIGIGGYRHIGFYDNSFSDYTANVEKNEQIVKKILAEKNQSLRYFSYPYLNTGKSNDDHVKFEAWLREHGLTSVKYTIDNNEWMYSYAYDMARNNNDVNTMNEVRTAFLEYMSKMFDHYETYSKDMFGRDIAQTMVLTPSRLVADSFDELSGMINKRGYQFVSMDEALKDEAYQTPENFAGKSGISWFERWQMGKGKQLLEEPKVDATVQKIWNKDKPK
jgi:beta-lactamase regulating signal transducer with metallopeptidase domain/peptidoglycan/xylan/chitin deacetylase (PgdA/CDA1 family)